MSETCPKSGCNGEFSSIRGLKTHWGKSHDEIAPWKKHTCSYCGVSFSRPPSQVRGEYSFCSTECMGRHQSENREYKKNLIEVSCEYCGSINERFESHVSPKRNFCDKDCKADWMHEIASPDELPRSQDGDRGPAYYGRIWEQQRKKALDEHGNSCWYDGCDRIECQNGKALHVHHIIPMRKFDEIEEAHRVENLIPVCAEHHRIVEDKPESYFHD